MIQTTVEACSLIGIFASSLLHLTNIVLHVGIRALYVECMQRYATSGLTCLDQGTWQFMAAYLVDNRTIPQTFIHDLESTWP